MTTAEIEKERADLLAQQQEIIMRLDCLRVTEIEQLKVKIQRALTLCKESEREDGVNTLRSYIDRVQAILERED